ncbi:MAG: UDP-N-acetylmuramate dehydrogenase [Vicinamibacterales bacterium]
MSDLEHAFQVAFGAGRLRSGVPLAPLTTFRVGGPAEWLFEARNAEELTAALTIARSHAVHVTMLGGGSNVLIADTGVRGLVIRTRGGTIRLAGSDRLEADAAVTINGLVRWTILRGVAGLEAWAGTPGTVGGAVVGNAHFEGRLIGDCVLSVRVMDLRGSVADIPADAMNFGYDRSRVQSSGEVVLAAAFRVGKGDPQALRERARASLAYRKRTQPLDAPSAGCIFQNPVPGVDPVPDGIPWSAGALVDRAGLKGTTIGGAQVSASHGNFIVNEGHATAAEIKRLIELCRASVKEQFGVELRDEIVYFGSFETS